MFINSSGPTVAPFWLSVRQHILQRFVFTIYFFSPVKMPEIMKAALVTAAGLLCSTTEMSGQTLSFAIPTGSLATEFDFWRTREYSVNVRRWVVMGALVSCRTASCPFSLHCDKRVSLLYNVRFQVGAWWRKMRQWEIYSNFITFIAKHNYLPYVKRETVMFLLSSVNTYRLKCCSTIRIHYCWYWIFFPLQSKPSLSSE